MTYKDVMKYCLALEGVTRKTLGEQSNAFAFCVADGVFAYFETGAPIQWRLSLRVTPENFDRLHFPPHTLQVRGKEEGCWLTIVRLENFDEQLLLELINWSYLASVQKIPTLIED